MMVKRGGFRDYVEWVNGRPAGLFGPITGGETFVICATPRRLDRSSADHQRRPRAAAEDPATFRQELATRKLDSAAEFRRQLAERQPDSPAEFRRLLRERLPRGLDYAVKCVRSNECQEEARR
jgi:hypothetical protein